jgi:hypothetical protein
MQLMMKSSLAAIKDAESSSGATAYGVEQNWMAIYIIEYSSRSLKKLFLPVNNKHTHQERCRLMLRHSLPVHFSCCTVPFIQLTQKLLLVVLFLVHLLLLQSRSLGPVHSSWA